MGSTEQPIEDERPRQQSGRRCDLGCESWPPDDEFENCPICGQPTTRYSNLYPLDLDEALAIKGRLDFDDFYTHEWPELREQWLLDHPEDDWRAELAAATYS